MVEKPQPLSNQNDNDEANLDLSFIEDEQKQINVPVSSYFEEKKPRSISKTSLMIDK